MIPDDADLIGPGYDTGEEAEQWEGPTAGDHSTAGRYVAWFLFLVARRRWREARILVQHAKP